MRSTVNSPRIGTEDLGALTIRQVAERLQVSEKTVRREIDEGKLDWVSVRGCLRVSSAQLAEYMSKNTVRGGSL